MAKVVHNTPKVRGSGHNPSPTISIHGSSSEGHSQIKRWHGTPDLSSDEDNIPIQSKKRAVNISPPSSPPPELSSEEEETPIRQQCTKKRSVPSKSRQGKGEGDDEDKHEHEVDHEGEEVFEDGEEEPASLGFQDPNTVAECIAGGLEGMKLYQR